MADAPLLTLPEVVVTPDEKPPDEKPPAADVAGMLLPGGALSLPPSVAAHDVQAASRLAGYDWQDIHDHADAMTAAADSAGYSQREIDAHLGWPDPKPLLDRLDNHWMGAVAADPAVADVLKPAADPAVADVLKPGDAPPDVEPLATPDMRFDYARALTDGHAKNSGDFARSYVDALATQTGDDDSGTVAPDTQARATEAALALAKTLPTHDAAMDYAIGLTHAAGLPLTPTTIANTKSNLLDEWAATNSDLPAIFGAAQRNPELRDRLTQPPRLPDLHPIGDALGRIYQAVKTGVADAYAEPLVGNANDMKTWHRYFGEPDTPMGVLNHIVGVAALGAGGAVDAGLRLPAAVIQGIARGGSQLVQEAGVPAGAADDAMRDLLALAVAVGAKDSPMRLRVVDPLKAPAEAVQELPAVQAFTPDAALHSQAQAIQAFHGTPHTFEAEPDFPLGRFRNEKIGTGEGAQAFGYGIYFAEEPKVAETYKKSGLQYSEPPTLEQQRGLNFLAGYGYAADYAALEGLPKHIDAIESEISRLKAEPDAGFSDRLVELQRNLRELESLDPNKMVERPGNTYTAKLHVDQNNLLDLDKTLGEQSPAIVSAIKKHLSQENRGVSLAFPEKTNASDWLHSMEVYHGSAENFASTLNDLGIQGTKYLDASSRKGGEGSRNYVIFDPKNIEVTARNGEAAELAKGYDAATALWGKLTEMHSGLSVPHAWQGLQMLWRGPQGMIDAASKAAAKDFAQATIRRYRGMADREIAAHFNTVEEYRRAINEHMPEFVRWVRMGMNKPAEKPLIMDLYDYMEGRSAGVTLNPNSPFIKVADALRGINEALRADIEAHAPDMGSFVDDYVTHLWTDRNAAAKLWSAGKTPEPIRGGGRQGSGASLNKRTIPTISEGLDAGLVPLILDPIENTLHYASGMLRFIAARKILADSKEAGYVKYGTSAPEPGWRALSGAASVLPAGENAIQRAYAPPGFAASYNNWIGRGIYDWNSPRYATVYEKLQIAANAMTALRFAFSLYHMTNIVRETAAAEMTNGLGRISRGDLISGLRDMGYGASVLPGIVDYAAKGRGIQKKYLDLGNEDPVVKLLTEAGFSPLGRSQRYGGITSPDLQTAAHGATLMQMLKRRSLGWTLAEEGRRIAGSAEEPGVYRAIMAGPRAVGFIINQAERVLDTINKPLFDHLIPKVKAAAAAAEMEAWLKRNMTATRDEQLSVARKIVDSMDDRFGELNQDNLFWPRAFKQMLNMMTVSVGWEYGTLRAYGGGAQDIFKGELNSTRARWMLAFPAQMALMNSIYQYIHTGQGPQSAKDLVLPLTGGKYGSASKYIGTPPERALAPGYEKDALQTYRSIVNVPDFTHIPANVANQVMGKLNPFWQALRTGITGQDAIGHNIAEEPNPPFQAWHIPAGVANWLRYLGRELTPIAAANQMVIHPGTHIDRAERFLGFQPAGSFFQNPEGAAANVAAHERTVTRGEARRAIREQQ